MAEAEMPASDEFVERLAKELAISLSRSYTVRLSKPISILMLMH